MTDHRKPKTTKARPSTKRGRGLGYDKGKAAGETYPKPAPAPLPPVDPNRLLRLDEVAPRLAVSMATLRRLIAFGRLPVVRVGRQLRVRPADLEAFIRSSTITPADEETEGTEE